MSDVRRSLPGADGKHNKHVNVVLHQLAATRAVSWPHTGCLHAQWRSAFSSSGGSGHSTGGHGAAAQRRAGQRLMFAAAATGGRPEAGLADAGLDKWSTDEDDGAIDPGSWGDGDTKPATPLLDTIEYPVHLKHLKLPQLRQLCKEIRADLIHTVSKVRCALPHAGWL